MSDEAVSMRVFFTLLACVSVVFVLLFWGLTKALIP